MSGSSLVLPRMSAIILFGLISGIRLCAVVSGSMEPNLPTWSLCVISTRTPYDKIQTGDIVVYNRRSDDTRIIHRVTKITPEGMITKGDANLQSDGVSVGRDNLYGKALFHLPYLGYCRKLTHAPIAWATMLVCMTGILAIEITDMHKSRKQICNTDQDFPDGNRHADEGKQ